MGQIVAMEKQIERKGTSTYMDMHLYALHIHIMETHFIRYSNKQINPFLACVGQFTCGTLISYDCVAREYVGYNQATSAHDSYPFIETDAIPINLL
jgi:hypothetical protein